MNLASDFVNVSNALFKITTTMNTFRDSVLKIDGIVMPYLRHFKLVGWSHHLCKIGTQKNINLRVMISQTRILRSIIIRNNKEYHKRLQMYYSRLLFDMIYLVLN